MRRISYVESLYQFELDRICDLGDKDFHRFHQVFCVSFGNRSETKVFAHWFFELDASLRSILYPGLELEGLHRFHQVFCISYGN